MKYIFILFSALNVVVSAWAPPQERFRLIWSLPNYSHTLKMRRSNLFRIFLTYLRFKLIWSLPHYSHTLTMRRVNLFVETLMYLSHLFVVRSTLSSIAFSGAPLGTVLSMLSSWSTSFLALLDLHKMVKSLLLYLLQNCFMCTSVQNHQAYKAGSVWKQQSFFPYRTGKKWKEKNNSMHYDFARSLLVRWRQLA